MKYRIFLIIFLAFGAFLLSSNFVFAEDEKNIACNCQCDSVIVSYYCFSTETECTNKCTSDKASKCPSGTMKPIIEECTEGKTCEPTKDVDEALCLTGAQKEETDSRYGKEPEVVLEVPFGEKGTEGDKIKGLAGYIVVAYEYFVGLIGIVAVMMIVWGGFKWTTSAGNSSQIASARSTITSAVVGLVLALTSYLLLATINPALVSVNKLKIPKVDYVGGYSFNCGTEEADNGVDAVSGGILAEGLNDTINKYAEKFKVSGVFVKSIMQKESSFNSQAMSTFTKKDGTEGHAYGLMQLLPATAESVKSNCGISDTTDGSYLMFHPEENICMGVAYLGSLKRQFTDYALVASGYNGGPGCNKASTACPGQMVWQCMEYDGYQRTRDYVKTLSDTIFPKICKESLTAAWPEPLEPAPGQPGGGGVY